MAYNALTLNENLANVGQRWAPKENLGRIVKLIVTPLDFSFATQSDAETETNWQDAFEQVADRCFVLPYVYNNEDASEDATMQDFTGGDSLKVRDGKYAERLHVHVSVADMRKLRTFDGFRGRVFKIDENGNILGTSPDGEKFQGFETTTMNIEKMPLSAGDTKRLVPIYIKEREVDEWLNRGVAINPLDLDTPFDPRDFDGLIDVKLTLISGAANELVVKAEADKKGVLIKGLSETTDWVAKDSAGSAESISGVTDNNDGTYTIAGTFTSGGTIDLSPAPDLSIDGFESTGSVSNGV